MTDPSSKRTAIMQLIKDYIACAKYMCKVLRDAYDTKGGTLLRARRINSIPKEGILENEYNFNFHGGGCYFEFENGAIDIDFGPDDRCDGFDAYRLYQFLTASKIKENIQSITESEIQAFLNELLTKRAIVQPGDFPNPNLYYLNSVTSL
jgi:hypothetical protein